MKTTEPSLSDLRIRRTLLGQLIRDVRKIAGCQAFETASPFGGRVSQMRKQHSVGEAGSCVSYMP